MEFTNRSTTDFEASESTIIENVAVNANQIPNAVLQRLMQEVKNDQANDMFAYDRAHNRHNRS